MTRNVAKPETSRAILRRIALLALIAACVAGCGTTNQRNGTEQLLLSDSVDRTVDKLDFGLLAGRKVYLDTTYIKPIKGLLFVNSDYIISSLRHKLTTSGCLIRETREEADYILEARVGALGSDSLQVTYGIPASSTLSQAASLVSQTPMIPAIPEMSVGKRDDVMSTSKIVAFAYHRETGTPVWQSGSAISRSDARDTWVLGAGPLQRGSIYRGARFAGLSIRTPHLFVRPDDPEHVSGDVSFADAHEFVSPALLEQQLAAETESDSAIVPASHEVPADE